MNKNQKSQNSNMILVAVVVIIIIAGVLLVVKKANNTSLKNPGNAQSLQNDQPIQNSNDLNSASSDLDNTNIDGLDHEINQISSDTSGF